MEKMSVGFVNTDHDSPILLPPDLRDWVTAAHHDAWSLDLLLRQCDRSRFLGGGNANGLEIGSNRFSVLPIEVFEAVTQRVHDAALNAVFWIDRLQRLGKVAETLEATDEDALEVAVFEFDGDGQHFLFAFEVDSKGEVNDAVGHFALVADFDDDGIKINDGVNGL